MADADSCPTCSSWKAGEVAGVRVVQWEGPPPEFLYHLTPEFHLRGIKRAHELRPSARGRGGFSAEGAVEGGISFTDNVREFVEKHPYAWNWRIVRIRTEEVPGVKPVVYVGGKNIIEQHQAMEAVRDRGGEARSMHFVKEHEWWTEKTVPLRPGHFSVSLPLA